MDYLSIKSVLAEKRGKGFENRLEKKGVNMKKILLLVNYVQK